MPDALTLFERSWPFLPAGWRLFCLEAGDVLYLACTDGPAPTDVRRLHPAEFRCVDLACPISFADATMRLAVHAWQRERELDAILETIGAIGSGS
jgi:hypothetical protein